MKKLLLTLLYLLVGISASFADYYEQLTASSTALQTGDKIIIAAKTGNNSWVGCTEKGSDNGTNKADITVTDSKISAADVTNAELTVFEVTESNNKVYLKGTSFNKFIGNTAEKNQIKFSDTQAIGYGLTINVSASDKKVIGNDASIVTYFVYNSTAEQNRFRFFKSSTISGNAYLAPVIFRLVEEKAVLGTPLFNGKDEPIEEVIKGTEVTITCENASKIVYTINEGAEVETEGDTVVITINEDSEITAWGIDAEGLKSEEKFAIYTISKAPGTVIFTPAAGNYPAGTQVVISSSDATIITYSYCEDTDEIETSSLALTLTENGTIEVIAENIYGTNEGNADYLIVSTPAFSVASGEIERNSEVTISAENARSIIYTINGGEAVTVEGETATIIINQPSETTVNINAYALGDNNTPTTAVNATYAIVAPTKIEFSVDFSQQTFSYKAADEYSTWDATDGFTQFLTRATKGESSSQYPQAYNKTYLRLYRTNSSGTLAHNNEITVYAPTGYYFVSVTSHNKSNSTSNVANKVTFDGTTTIDVVDGIATYTGFAEFATSFTFNVNASNAISCDFASFDFTMKKLAPNTFVTFDGDVDHAPTNALVNDDGTWKAKEIVFVDNMAYTNDKEITAETVKFERIPGNHNYWNAIVLPFDVPFSVWSEHFEAITLHHLDNTGENAMIVLNHLGSEDAVDEESTKMKANTPYLIKRKGDSSAESFNLQLSNTTVKPAGDCIATGDGAMLVGVYTPTPINEIANAYGLAQGLFMKASPTNTSPIKPFHAYLKLITSNAKPQLRIIVNDEETVGFSDIKVDTMEEDVFYDMMGRKVEFPTNGIYIFNGHKVLVK